MDKTIEKAIQQGFDDYQDSDMWNMATNERDVYTLGWEEGYEWILTELTMNGKISEETLKEYMNKL